MQPRRKSLRRSGPKVGANYRGTKSDSKNRGYVWRGKVLAMARLYGNVDEFRPLSEEVKALRLGAWGRSTGFQYMRVCYGGCEPLS